MRRRTAVAWIALPVVLTALTGMANAQKPAKLRTKIMQAGSISGTVKWPTKGKPTKLEIGQNPCNAVKVALFRESSGDDGGFRMPEWVRAVSAKPRGGYQSGCAFRIQPVPRNKWMFVTASYNGEWDNNPALSVSSEMKKFFLTGMSQTFVLQMTVSAPPE
jgi:hypothetical protein